MELTVRSVKKKKKKKKILCIRLHVSQYKNTNKRRRQYAVNLITKAEHQKKKADRDGTRSTMLRYISFEDKAKNLNRCQELLNRFKKKLNP